MPFAWNTAFEQLKSALSAELLTLAECKDIKWQLNYQIATLKRANSHPAVKGVKILLP